MAAGSFYCDGTGICDVKLLFHMNMQGYGLGKLGELASEQVKWYQVLKKKTLKIQSETYLYLRRLVISLLMVSLASICSSSSRCSLRLWPLVLASSSSASSNCLFKALTLLLTLSTWQQQHSIRYCHHSCQINIIISHDNIYNNRVETIVSSSRGNTDI